MQAIEVPEAKSLRWLANQFPYIKEPKNDTEKFSNIIRRYTIAGAEKLEAQTATIALLKEDAVSSEVLYSLAEAINALAGPEGVINCAATQSVINWTALQEAVKKLREIYDLLQNKKVNT